MPLRYEVEGKLAQDRLCGAPVYQLILSLRGQAEGFNNLNCDPCVLNVDATEFAKFDVGDTLLMGITIAEVARPRPAYASVFPVRKLDQ